MRAPFGPGGLLRRTLAVAAKVAFGLCLFVLALLSLAAALNGWGPLAGDPACLGSPGPGLGDALAVHLASGLVFASRVLVALSAFTTFFVAASVVANPGMVTPRAAAEMSLFGPGPLAAGWLCALFTMIGGC